MQTFWLRYRGTRFPIRRGEYILGRSPYCSIVISNALASRQHCAVRLTSSGLVIVDLNSRNGTLVNGKRLESEQPLNAGDIIRIGSDSIEVLLADSPADKRGGAQRRGERHDTLDRLEIESREPPESESAGSIEEDSCTYTHSSTIELVVELVRTTSTLPDRMERSTTIQRSIDSLVEVRLQRCKAFEPKDSERLLEAARSLASWHDDGRLDGWLRDIEGALGAKQ